jgi:hypothetical protein
MSHKIPWGVDLIRAYLKIHVDPGLGVSWPGPLVADVPSSDDLPFIYLTRAASLLSVPQSILAPVVTVGLTPNNNDVWVEIYYNGAINTTRTVTSAPTLTNSAENLVGSSISSREAASLTVHRDHQYVLGLYQPANDGTLLQIEQVAWVVAPSAQYP